jgi:hypothetical protein
MSKHDQDAAKKMIAGTLYLRLDVPQKSVQGAWGVGPGAVLEVSPTGHDSQSKLPEGMMSGLQKLNWDFFPNDGVRYGKLSFDHNTVHLYLEGLPPNNVEIYLDFVQINSIDDFTKAFNQVFSKVPLQDEHPEWPAEVRNAIAEHKVVIGMTKEQAFDVVGTPLDIKTENVNGVETEIWHPRQDRGRTLRAVRFAKERLGSTGFPVQLKFVDGKLQVIE